MKILYITNYNSIAKISGGFINDYLNDTIFYGLYELQQEGIISEIIDSTPIISLYKEYKNVIPKQNLWGGMTTFWLIDEDKINRSNIEEKIKEKYFDLIIYGAIRRCQDYYNLVTQYYSNNKIICIDGNDENDCDSKFYEKHLYFKRELIDDEYLTEKNHPNLKPISFSIPTCKLATQIFEKEKEFGTVLPGQPETYIFKDEQLYYDDYNKSYYGLTTKKAGWDCMRHYEILANNCIPYFPGLEDCPKNTLTHLPKDLLINIKNKIHDIDNEEYNKYLNLLNHYTKNHLTTKSMAQYILDEYKQTISS